MGDDTLKQQEDKEKDKEKRKQDDDDDGDWRIRFDAQTGNIDGNAHIANNQTIFYGNRSEAERKRLQ